MTNICIARLRSRTKYTEPLEHIIDSYCYLLKRYINDKDHKFTFWNCSFDGSRPTKDIEAIKNADIIVIPSEAEFTYHIPGYIHTLDLKKSNEVLKTLEPYLEGKTVIILRSDRRDDIDLYQNHVFKGINIKYHVIDEVDFPVNVHGLKFYFIRNQINSSLDDTKPDKEYDFIYWGGDKKKTIGGAKSGDQRHLILKHIHGIPNIKGLWIGRFSNFRRDHKFMSMKELIPHLEKSNATLCFNWMDDKATTSRYIEAIAAGVIPLVWQNYDSDNELVCDDWQRCWSEEDVKAKLEQLRDRGFSDDMFIKLENSLMKRLPCQDEYYMLFEAHMDRIVLDF